MTGDAGEDPAGLRAEQLRRYRAAVARTDALLDAAATAQPRDPEGVRIRAEQRMARVRSFLGELGDPHRRVPLVHVTGTSGKGSTAAMIAAMLRAGGYRVGLHTSPYLQAATEKLQIDGQLAEPVWFADLVDRVLDAAERSAVFANAPITYGEAWVVFALAGIADAGCDVGVVEVGAGGRYDLTNVIVPVVSVITTVGLDHTETLGETIAEIAHHKAGIIKAGVPVVTGVADEPAWSVIREEAERLGAPLAQAVDGGAFADVRVGSDGTSFRDLLTGRVLEVGMAGRHQAANGAVALAAVRLLRERGLAVSDDAQAAGLLAGRLPGRGEWMPGRPDVLLDGAHNPQKIEALAKALAEQPREGRTIVVAGVLGSKDHAEIVRALAPVATVLVATTPQVTAKPGLDAEAFAASARAAGVPEVVVEPDPLRAIDRAIAMAASGDLVGVTGSLYLVGTIRSRWYLPDEVVIQRTPWPTVAGKGQL